MTRSLPIQLMALYIIVPSLLVACAPISTGDLGPQAAQALAATPPGAAPGTCWHRQDTPPIIETVTEDVLVVPTQLRADGSVEAPPIYRNEIRQITRNEPRGDWFETPCAHLQTPEFISSLQRALTARGIYNGPISGQIDPATQVAIGQFQASTGLKSKTLALVTARHIGLIAVERPEE